MGLFAEVFDTTRIAPEELAAAKTILMLGALQPDPCSLASVHAINSCFILNECREPEFYSLVIKGRIRFHRRTSDGNPESPREELIRRMGIEPYFCYAWPETFHPSTHQPELRLCADVRRRLSGKKVYFSDDALRSRIEGALELFSAIEQAPPFQEHPRTNSFHTSLGAAVEDIPKDEEHAGVRQLVGQLASDARASRRSSTYQMIDDAAFDAGTKQRAKDVVDACYNSAVAHSLGAQFLSSRRLIDLGGNFHQSNAPTKSVLACIDESEEARGHLAYLMDQPLSWKLVYDVMAQISSFNQFDAVIAKRRLAENLADKSLAVRIQRSMLHGTLTAGVAVVSVAVPQLLIFEGGVANWSMLSAATLAFVAGSSSEFLKLGQTKSIPKKRADTIEKRLSGWLDRERRDD